jgi:hypothetical protein
MAFKQALWDGSDPSYSPCISWSGKHPQWKCPKKYLDAGYSVKAIRIDLPGDKNDEHQPKRALQCRQYTQELERWWNSQDKAAIEPDTWHWLIAKYKTDDFSPFQQVKGNTANGYLDQLKKLENSIGHMKIGALCYQRSSRSSLKCARKAEPTITFNDILA